MLGGIKIIPRDQIDKEENRNSDAKGKKKKSTSRKQKGSKRGKKNYSSDDETEKIDKGFKRKKKWYSSEEYESDAEEKKKRKYKSSKKGSRRGKKRYSSSDDDYSSSSEDEDQKNRREKEKSEIGRKEIGMDWMLRPANKAPQVMVENQVEEPPEEVAEANPRELNPYLKDNGTGYPEDEKKGGSDRLISSSVVVGDGGASWRLKALKRAQEQATRDGRSIDEVVKERWGSIGDLAVSAASQRAAPLRAHLRAIKSRQQGQADENQTDSDNRVRDTGKNPGRDYLRDVSHRHSEMRAPKVGDSLSWGKRKGHNISAESSGIISAAVSSINKFSNDGSFMDKFHQKPNEEPAGTVSVESDEVSPVMSTNQLAAKALQLRMKGKNEEAERLLQEVEKMKAATQGAVSRQQQNTESTNRYVVQDVSIRKRKDEDDADVHLARKIAQNKQYGRPDDEYDYEDGPIRKSRKKQTTGKQTRILTQQERCLFCFENPNRPKHLVVSIANFTYLMLPQRQSLVPGHCCILPMQHEASTRTLDDNVWGEIRNFKKCLIMMFAQQEKDVVFLETVIALAQQRRHCLIDCIPLPRDIAKDAPLYFKKAIDEAEDEWSQHNAKKLIDTSKKGLRGSIPINFPYFHVEFGLDRGFVHVIDDEKDFNSNLGFNVIRGMLQLAEEDMYRRNRRQESFETQKEAVKAFARDWEPFDWTKQLD